MPPARRRETRTPEARLEEAAGLARAIDLNVVEQGLVTLNQRAAGDLYRHRQGR